MQLWVQSGTCTAQCSCMMQQRNLAVRRLNSNACQLLFGQASCMQCAVQGGSRHECWSVHHLVTWASASCLCCSALFRLHRRPATCPSRTSLLLLAFTSCPSSCMQHTFLSVRSCFAFGTLQTKVTLQVCSQPESLCIHQHCDAC